MAETLHLGIDQGFTKTAVAIRDKSENTLFEAVDETFSIGMTNEEKHLNRIQKLLTQVQQYKSNMFDVYIASNGYLSGQWKEILKTNGINIRNLEWFNDTHSHYGLTDMPGNCFTLASGSYFNLMYYDLHNNVSFFGFHNSFDPGKISGFEFGNLLLELWVKSHFEGNYPELSKDIEKEIGYTGESVYESITRLSKVENQALVVNLAKLVPRHVSIPEINTYIHQAIDKIVMAINVLRENLRVNNVKYLFVGGSMWKNDFLLESLSNKMNEHLQIQVIRASGNPAVGAIRFRVQNPTAYIKTW